jgi:tetratricopeptide (TPR) repeat protein
MRSRQLPTQVREYRFVHARRQLLVCRAKGAGVLICTDHGICNTVQLMRVVVPSIIAFVLLAGALPVSAQSSAAAHSDKGLQLAQAGNLTGAESELRAAVALAPADPEFLIELATILAMEKKLEDSTTFFKRALKLDPGNLTARRYLAANLWQLHRYPEAKENLQLILKQKSDDAPSRLLLGMVAENMKDYATAARMLASVREEVRKQPESIAALAVSYYHLGEEEKARTTLAELENHAAGTRAVLLGAQIADENADYESAEGLLSSIKPSYPDQADLDYRIATVQYHAGKFVESGQTLAQLVRSGNGSAQIFNLLGWCHQKQGQLDQAQQAFEQGIGIQPGDEANYLDLQKVLLARNRIAAALEVAKRTTDALPNSARAFAMRGAIETQASQFTNAVTSYRRAKELDPASADNALGLADTEFAADMTKQARAEYESGIKQFPKDAPFRIHFASALLKESEAEEDPLAEARAEALLKSAVKLDPSSVQAYCQLGEIALRENHTADALHDYEAAVKLDPESAKAHFGLSKVYRRLGKTEEATQEAKLFEKLQEAESHSPTAALPEGPRN